MNEIKSMRKRLGLSQAELAELLGVNRSTLAHAEISRRELSTKAYLRFARLSRLEFNIDPQPAADLLSDPLLNAHIERALADAIEQAEHDLARLARQLADAKARLTQRARRAQWLARLAAEPPANPADAQREASVIQNLSAHTTDMDAAALYIRIRATNIAIETKQLELNLLRDLAKP